jgi:hypothetical protein
MTDREATNDFKQGRSSSSCRRQASRPFARRRARAAHDWRVSLDPRHSNRMIVRPSQGEAKEQTLDRAAAEFEGFSRN